MCITFQMPLVIMHMPLFPLEIGVDVFQLFKYLEMSGMQILHVMHINLRKYIMEITSWNIFLILLYFKLFSLQLFWAVYFIFNTQYLMTMDFFAHSYFQLTDGPYVPALMLVLVAKETSVKNKKKYLEDISTYASRKYDIFCS